MTTTRTWEIADDKPESYSLSCIGKLKVIGIDWRINLIVFYSRKMAKLVSWCPGMMYFPVVCFTILGLCSYTHSYTGTWNRHAVSMCSPSEGRTHFWSMSFLCRPIVVHEKWFTIVTIDTLYYKCLNCIMILISQEMMWKTSKHAVTISFHCVKHVTWLIGKSGGVMTEDTEKTEDVLSFVICPETKEGGAMCKVMM